MPYLGIFWFVPDAAPWSVILADKTPLDLAERYGDWLTHDGGHAEFWEWLAGRPYDEVARRTPLAIPWFYDYAEWPRGRVVFDLPTQTFVVLADRKLHLPGFISEIIREFDLPADKVLVQSDSHYDDTLPVPPTRAASQGN